MNARIIGVKFLGNSKEYYFISHDDVVIGDKVVVDTRDGFALATVSNDNVSDATIKPTKELVARVDMTAYNVRRAREVRIAELRAKMDARVQDSYQLAVYEMLAKNDPELASMFEELKGLL